MSTIIEKRLSTILSRNWWVLLLRGIVAIAFGIVTWLMPGISLATLVLLFGAYTLANGIFGLWAAIAGRKEHEDWWVLLLWALVDIGIGILVFMAPGAIALAILFYIAAWAIATGVLQIVAAIRLRKEITNEWRLILAGLASVAFGVLIMAQPGASALALLWLIAAYAVIFGILLVILAFRMRAFGNKLAHS
ncbi:MAG TPA: HdeD family acid-resistance protein [Thermoflexales bacterium]|nr:HdeD family acid-resistance protein [Thermoflexales bacterium]HQW34572.1 HdeD family acid-resistance protein [Thermoflexales bacterium]HQZ23143.1 HdeD family acid-resistance protein [Thermoflexales bacterium]